MLGEGLAVVMQTANHLILYDTGPKFLSGDAGATTILPYLRSQNIDYIDTMIVSHGDGDHSGGVNSILTKMKVKTVFASAPDKIQMQNVNVQACMRSQEWTWDGIKFDILYPPATLPAGATGSMMLHVS